MSIPLFKGNQIHDVVITPLRQITDERGKIMHILKSTDSTFEKFGEVYVSCGYPGVIKAWHIHTEMTINDCCIKGMMKLVIYDCRKDSPTFGNLMEINMGEDNYCIVKIPPGLANGYKAYGTELAYLINCADMPHKKGELVYIDPFENEIPYKWDLKHG